MLIGSIVVNMNFVAVIIVNRSNVEQIANVLMAENAEQSFRLQSDLLNDLIAKRIDSVKSKLICGVSRQEYVVKTIQKPVLE